MKVEVIDKRTGRTRSMTRRDAEILVKLKRATYVETAAAGTYQTRQMVAGEPAAPEFLISDAVRSHAEENGIDPAAITGTGKGGRVLKTDIDAAIRARDGE